MIECVYIRKKIGGVIFTLLNHSKYIIIHFNSVLFLFLHYFFKYKLNSSIVDKNQIIILTSKKRSHN